MNAPSLPLASTVTASPRRPAPPHVIEHLHFDFAFADERGAFDLQGRIGRFAGERSPQVIDEVFAEVFNEPGGHDAVLQLERLEVDLGVLPLHETDSEWEARLRDALHRVLLDLSLPAANDSARPQARHRTRERADFEALWGWLEQGTLPWHADAAAAVALDALVARVLTLHAPALAAALVAAPDRAQRLRRVARQWRPDQWLVLARALAADSGRAVPPRVAQAPSPSERAERIESWLLDLAGGPSPAQPPRLAGTAQRVPGREPASAPGAADRQMAAVEQGAAATEPISVSTEATAPPLETAWRAAAQSPEAALRLIAHIVDALDREPGALQRCMLERPPAPDTWAVLMRGLGTLQRHRLIRLLAAPGEADLLALLSDSVMLQSLSKAAKASDLERAIRAALAGALLTKRELAAQLRSSTLRQFTPPALLRVLDAWAAPEPEPGLGGEDSRQPVQHTAGDAAAADWRHRLEHQLAHAHFPPADLAWTMALRHDPAWLMKRLHHHGRRAEWRRRFESVLTAERWHELLDLWLAPADRPALARRMAGEWSVLVRGSIGAGSGPSTSASAGSRPVPGPSPSLHPNPHASASQLRRWLLGHLLLGRAQGLDLAEAEAHLERRVSLECLDHEESGDSRESLESGERRDRPATSRDLAAQARVLQELASLLTRLAGLSGILRPTWNRSDEAPVVAELAAALTWLKALPEPLPVGLRLAMSRTLESGSNARKLFGALGPAGREQLLQSLHPREARDALAALAAWRHAGQAEGLFSEAALASLGWRIVVEGLFEEGRVFSTDEFTERWRHAMRSGGTPNAQVPADERLGSASDHPPPVAADAPQRPNMQPVVGRVEAMPNAPQPISSGEVSTPNATVIAGETLYVSNAGMVLFGPYLPKLWSRLKLTEGDAFVNDAAAERAVHLLQWLASGRQGWPESALVLNKLMCGIALAQPIVRDLELEAEELGIARGLLEAVIEHWRGLGRTSVAGLRQTFLQREGALTRRDEDWLLVVAPGPFDMLMDQLPWGYKTMRYPWMNEVLHVQWR